MRRFRCFILVMLLVSGPVAVADDVASYAGDPVTVGEWMTDALKTIDKSATGALHLFRFKDPMYVLLEPIQWQSDDPNSPISPVTVPEGFVTDLTSVPRVFWSVFRPDGEYTYPAIVHDYLYWQQDRDREEADEVFRQMMKEFDVDAVLAIHKAVRVGGGIAWRKNAKLKSAGEQRLLRRFPQDPKMTWEKWKTRDVFPKQSG